MVRVGGGGGWHTPPHTPPHHSRGGLVWRGWGSPSRQGGGGGGMGGRGMWGGCHPNHPSSRPPRVLVEVPPPSGGGGGGVGGVATIPLTGGGVVWCPRPGGGAYKHPVDLGGGPQESQGGGWCAGGFRCHRPRGRSRVWELPDPGGGCAFPKHPAPTLSHGVGCPYPLGGGGWGRHTGWSPSPPHNIGVRGE